MHPGEHKSASKLVFINIDYGVATGLFGLIVGGFFGEFKKGVTFALSKVGCSWFFGRCSRGRVVGNGRTLLVTDAVAVATSIEIAFVGVIELYVPNMVLEPMMVDT